MLNTTLSMRDTEKLDNLVIIETGTVEQIPTFFRKNWDFIYRSQSGKRSCWTQICRRFQHTDGVSTPFVTATDGTFSSTLLSRNLCSNTVVDVQYYHDFHR
jgi:hypothetical protein